MKRAGTHFVVLILASLVIYFSFLHMIFFSFSELPHGRIICFISITPSTNTRVRVFLQQCRYSVFTRAYVLTSAGSIGPFQLLYIRYVSTAVHLHQVCDIFCILGREQAPRSRKSELLNRFISANIYKQRNPGVFVFILYNS